MNAAVTMPAEDETLRERLRRGPLTLPEWLRYARSLAAGLAEVHSQ